MAKKIGKKITDPKEVDMFLNLKSKDITTSFIMENFASFDFEPPKYYTFDIIHIPKGAFTNGEYQNDEEFDTTIGSWIFNKFFIEEDLIGVIGYDDRPVNSKHFDDLDDELTYALIEDDITLNQLKLFLDKTQKFMPYVNILSPSVTEKLLLCTEPIRKEKQKLLKKYEKELKSQGNEVVSEKIEKELLDFAANYLDGDDSMDCYNSGARMKWGNHFKNMYVMRGAAKDPDPNKGYNVLTSNYSDGFGRDEYAALANTLAAGPYNRGKKTGLGGYWEKLFVSAFQHLKLDPAGSDCGTKRYKEVVIDNPKEYMYNYIIEGNKLVELTSKNIDKYKGKKVKMRFSSLCESKTGFCNHCAGNLPYRIGIENIGMMLSAIPAKLKLLSMKSFHDSNVKTIEIDLNKAFDD